MRRKVQNSRFLFKTTVLCLRFKKLLFFLHKINRPSAKMSADGTIQNCVTEYYKSYVTSCSVAFKKFKGQVRRERHQATTNQKTVLANNWKMFSQRTAILSQGCVGKFYVKTKAKEVVFSAKCREEYTQRFRPKQSSN